MSQDILKETRTCALLKALQCTPATLNCKFSDFKKLNYNYDDDKQPTFWGLLQYFGWEVDTQSASASQYLFMNKKINVTGVTLQSMLNHERKKHNIVDTIPYNYIHNVMSPLSCNNAECDWERITYNFNRLSEFYNKHDEVYNGVYFGKLGEVGNVNKEKNGCVGELISSQFINFVIELIASAASATSLECKNTCQILTMDFVIKIQNTNYRTCVEDMQHWKKLPKAEYFENGTIYFVFNPSGQHYVLVGFNKNNISVYDSLIGEDLNKLLKDEKKEISFIDATAVLKRKIMRNNKRKNKILNKVLIMVEKIIRFMNLTNTVAQPTFQACLQQLPKSNDCGVAACVHMYLISTGVAPIHLDLKEGGAILREIRYKMSNLLIMDLLKRVEVKEVAEEEVKDKAKHEAKDKAKEIAKEVAEVVPKHKAEEVGKQVANEVAKHEADEVAKAIDKYFAMNGASNNGASNNGASNNGASNEVPADGQDTGQDDWLKAFSCSGSSLSMKSKSAMLYAVIDNTLDLGCEKMYDYKPTVKEFKKQIETTNEIQPLALHYIDSNTRIKENKNFNEIVDEINSDRKRDLVASIPLHTYIMAQCKLVQDNETSKYEALNNVCSNKEDTSRSLTLPWGKIFILPRGLEKARHEWSPGEDVKIYSLGDFFPTIPVANRFFISANDSIHHAEHAIQAQVILAGDSQVRMMNNFEVGFKFKGKEKTSLRQHCVTAEGCSDIYMVLGSLLAFTTRMLNSGSNIVFRCNHGRRRSVSLALFCLRCVAVKKTCYKSFKNAVAKFLKSGNGFPTDQKPNVDGIEKLFGELTTNYDLLEAKCIQKLSLSSRQQNASLAMVNTKPINPGLSKFDLVGGHMVSHKIAMVHNNMQLLQRNNNVAAQLHITLLTNNTTVINILDAQQDGNLKQVISSARHIYNSAVTRNSKSFQDELEDKKVSELKEELIAKRRLIIAPSDLIRKRKRNDQKRR